MNQVKKPPTSSQSLLLVGIFTLMIILLVVFLYYNSTKDYKVLLNDVVPLYNIPSMVGISILALYFIYLVLYIFS